MLMPRLVSKGYVPLKDGDCDRWVDITGDVFFYTLNRQGEKVECKGSAWVWREDAEVVVYADDGG
jgi:hypothetical protein